MTLTEITPFIAGPVLGLLSVWLAYLAYQRGSRADDAAAENAANAAVYAGYGGLLQRYQEDNADLRLRLHNAEQRIGLLLERLEST